MSHWSSVGTGVGTIKREGHTLLNLDYLEDQGAAARRYGPARGATSSGWASRASGPRAGLVDLPTGCLNPVHDVMEDDDCSTRAGNCRRVGSERVQP
jgi:hypothetical protein